MKFKKLGFTTLEGLSLANFEDGWSMEYGSGGSYTADVLLNGKRVATIEEAGDGGCANVHYVNKDHKAEDALVLAFLKRVDPHYGPDSEFDFYKNTTEASDSEYTSLVSCLLLEREAIKYAKKQFKAGYILVMVLTDGFQDSFIASRIDDEQRLTDYAKNKGYLTKMKIKKFLRENTLATI